MKVLAFAGSNHSKSINKQLVTYAAKALQENFVEDADIEVLDLNDFEMPIYSQDREGDSGIPDAAHVLFNKIGTADALIISFAEHNGSYTAAYKNIFDWMSRINPKVYQKKPMVLLSTSPGPGGAGSVLAAAVNSAPYFEADVKGSLSIPSFYDNFDAENIKLINADLKTELEKTLKALSLALK